MQSICDQLTVDRSQTYLEAASRMFDTLLVLAMKLTETLSEISVLIFWHTLTSFMISHIKILSCHTFERKIFCMFVCF